MLPLVHAAPDHSAGRLPQADSPRPLVQGAFVAGGLGGALVLRVGRVGPPPRRGCRRARWLLATSGDEWCPARSVRRRHSVRVLPLSHRPAAACATALRLSPLVFSPFALRLFFCAGSSSPSSSRCRLPGVTATGGRPLAPDGVRRAGADTPRAWAVCQLAGAAFHRVACLPPARSAHVSRGRVVPLPAARPAVVFRCCNCNIQTHAVGRMGARVVAAASMRPSPDIASGPCSV